MSAEFEEFLKNKFADSRDKEQLKMETSSRARLRYFKDTVKEINQTELEKQETRKNDELAAIQKKKEVGLAKIESLKCDNLKKFTTEKARIEEEAAKEMKETNEKYKEIIEKHLTEMEIKMIGLEKELMEVESSRTEAYLKNNAIKTKLMDEYDEQVEKTTRDQEKREEMRNKERMEQEVANMESSLQNAMQLAAKDDKNVDERIALHQQLKEENMQHQIQMFRLLSVTHNRSNAKTLNNFVGQLKDTMEMVQNNHSQCVRFFVDGLDEKKLARAERELEDLRENIQQIGGILLRIEGKLADLEENQEKIERREQIKVIKSTNFVLSNCLASILGRFTVKNSPRNVEDENQLSAHMQQLMELITQFEMFDSNNADIMEHLRSYVPQ